MFTKSIIKITKKSQNHRCLDLVYSLVWIISPSLEE